MFSNRFNTRNDPLLEAAAAAMKDGDVRRQAEAFVNEQFGVYSRKAVVREELAAYDAALEEAYGALKEGKSLDPVGREDKDIDNDGDHDKSDKYLLNRRKTIGRAMGKKMEEGTAEAETSMSVTKDNKPSTPAQTNASTSGPSASDKAALASKIKTMREEQIDEISQKTAMSAYASSRDPDSESDGRTGDRLKKHIERKFGKKAGEHAERHADAEHWGRSDRKTQKPDRLSSDNRWGKNRLTKSGKVHQQDVDTKKSRIKSRLGSHTKANLPEGYELDEAAYSAKAARAGKDIGKPGKQFSKIAKSAGKRYGSEERGKKVAGAILARIRAKHMKEENLEELSAFGKEFAAARAAGKSEFMSKTTGKMTTTALKSPSSSASKPTGSSAIAGVNPGISTRQAAQGTTIKQSGGFSTDAPKPSASNYPDRGNVATGKSFDAIDKATNAAADKAATARVKAAVAGTDYAKPSKPADSNIGGKTQHWSDQGAKERAGSMASQAATVSAAGDKPSASTGTQSVPTPPSRPASISSTSTPAPAAAPQPGAPKNDASAGVKKLMAMSESVQIGDYKYRII